MKLKTLAMALGLMVATGAQAELVELDYLNEGDGLITVDTVSGLDWLDLKFTSGMSIYQARSVIPEGFRVANYDEVYSLYDNNFDLTGMKLLESSLQTNRTHNLSGEGDEDYAKIYEFIDMFGSTWKEEVSGQQYNAFNGLFEGKDRYAYSVVMTVDYQSKSSSYEDNKRTSMSIDEKGKSSISTSNNAGVFLVRDTQYVSDVSAPIAFAGGLSLLGLAGMRRKK